MPTKVSLFSGDFMHGLGTTLQLKWAYEGKIRSGAYCDVQGRDFQMRLYSRLG